MKIFKNFLFLISISYNIVYEKLINKTKLEQNQYFFNIFRIYK